MGVVGYAAVLGKSGFETVETGVVVRGIGAGAGGVVLSTGGELWSADVPVVTGAECGLEESRVLDRVLDEDFASVSGACWDCPEVVAAVLTVGAAGKVLAPTWASECLLEAGVSEVLSVRGLVSATGRLVRTRAKVGFSVSSELLVCLGGSDAVAGGWGVGWAASATACAAGAACGLG